ncbi:hypothetical protein Lal_00036571 [Lupinus albus]|nr:hypothetical protein Lal_00036571 [Lupinus albus]
MKFFQRVGGLHQCWNVPFTSMFFYYVLLSACSILNFRAIYSFNPQCNFSSVLARHYNHNTSLLGLTFLMCLSPNRVTLDKWWRNKQFWLIGGTSAHPAIVLQGLLKVIVGVDILFTLTSKSATLEDGDDEFVDIYVWSFLMIPPITIMMVNAIAIGVGVARTLYNPFPQWSKLVGGVLCHLFPARGLMGRRGKAPTIVYVPPL